MIAPTVHLNGTSKASLLDAVTQAMLSVHDAQVKLREVSPNGRDYYVQPDGNLRQAEEQFQGMYARLESVKAELCALSLDIDCQGKKR